VLFLFLARARREIKLLAHLKPCLVRPVTPKGAVNI
jgi:hypothetical protein